MPGEIEEIKRRLDLADFVQGYVPIKRRGRYFVACCPFHKEKTPSFTIFPDKQRFHCFGCGRSGDIFTFLMEQEGLDFAGALRTLADHCGVPLSGRQEREGRARKDDTERLSRALQAALDYFRRSFEGQTGKKAMEYLRGRGFTDRTLALYEIGYSPDSWDGLIGHAGRLSIPAKDLAEAGLAKKNEAGKYYDFFRGRVMFPVRDAGKRLVGFGGRVMDGGEPKYLNSPETPLFNKRRLLYGIHIARERMVKEKHFLMMEGYTDVMMAEQAGVGPAVATLGTALSEDHARFLKRFSLPVFLVYDSDEAGQNAAGRSLPVFLKVGLDARVMAVPEGKDPCDFLLKGEASRLAWAGIRDKSPGIFEFQLGRLLAGSPEGIEARLKIATEMLEPLCLAGDAFRREVYIEQLSKRLGMESGILEKKLGALDAEKTERGDRAAANSVLPVPVMKRVTAPRDACYYILAILLADEDLCAEFGEMSRELTVPGTVTGRLLRAWCDAHTGEDAVAAPVFESGLGPEDITVFRLAAAEELPSGEGLRDMLAEKIGQLADPELKARHLLEEVKRAEAAGDNAKVRELMQEMNALRRK